MKFKAMMLAGALVALASPVFAQNQATASDATFNGTWGAYVGGWTVQLTVVNGAGLLDLTCGANSFPKNKVVVGPGGKVTGKVTTGSYTRNFDTTISNFQVPYEKGPCDTRNGVALKKS